LTLSALHSFCMKHPDKSVAYIHNRNQFGDKENDNNLIRRMLTKAVFTDECFNLQNPTTTSNSGISQPSRDCNVCSARFSPLPHFHASGNMWTADCMYISKLVDPITFRAKMDDAVNSASFYDRLGGANKISLAWTGRSIWSAGHWVYSHPDVSPCDVYSEKSFTWNNDNIAANDDWTPDLAYAPRFPSLLDYEKKYERFITSPERSRRQWVSLPGRIHEWNFLYKKIPDQKSWVWDFYDASQDYMLSLFGVL